MEVYNKKYVQGYRNGYLAGLQESDYKIGYRKGLADGLQRANYKMIQEIYLSGFGSDKIYRDDLVSAKVKYLFTIIKKPYYY